MYPVACGHVERLWLLCCSSVSVDPFTKKDWYDVKAPATFQTRNVGQTLVTRTQGKSELVDAASDMHSHSHMKWRGRFFAHLFKVALTSFS